MSSSTGGLVYPRCPMPYTGMQCQRTWADELSTDIYNQLYGWYFVNTLVLSIIAFTQTIRLVKSKGLKPLTLQHYLFLLVDFGAATFLIRCVDPGSLQDFLPLLILFLCTDLCTAAVYSIIFIVVMSWVKLIHLIRPPDPSRRIQLHHIQLFERVFIIFLFAYTFICSIITYLVHPSYIGDALKTMNFILFNMLFIVIGWLQALPIYRTLMKPVPNLSAEITARKKAQVGVVLKLMTVLTILSAGAIEIQWWSVHTNLERPWDWKYHAWGPPHKNLGGMMEAFQFDCIQWICLMATLFFFRRFSGSGTTGSTPAIRPQPNPSPTPSFGASNSPKINAPAAAVVNSLQNPNVLASANNRTESAMYDSHATMGRLHGVTLDGSVPQGHKWLSFKDENDGL